MQHSTVYACPWNLYSYEHLAAGIGSMIPLFRNLHTWACDPAVTHPSCMRTSDWIKRYCDTIVRSQKPQVFPLMSKLGSIEHLLHWVCISRCHAPNHFLHFHLTTNTGLSRAVCMQDSIKVYSHVAWSKDLLVPFYVEVRAWWDLWPKGSNEWDGQNLYASKYIINTSVATILHISIIMQGTRLNQMGLLPG